MFTYISYQYTGIVKQPLGTTSTMDRAMEMRKLGIFRCCSLCRNTLRYYVRLRSGTTRCVINCCAPARIDESVRRFYPLLGKPQV